jgi:hypothetical protein
MKHFKTWLGLGLIFCLVTNANARASFKDKLEMIKTAKIIAIVEIGEVERTSVKGQVWTYEQKASANVVQVIKGELPSQTVLYGDQSFECAQCRWQTGRYLVFLDHDKELLTGNNWQYSACKITGETILWFPESEVFKSKPMRLTSVVAGIQKILSKASK